MSDMKALKGNANKVVVHPKLSNVYYQLLLLGKKRSRG